MPTAHNSLRRQLLAVSALVSLLLVSLCAVLPAYAADYRVGPGDVLRISIFDHPELNADARISETGGMSFPLVGQLAVGGLSADEVGSLLAKRLTEGGYLSKPQVSVLVMDFESQKISVMGQVAKPGQYSLAASGRLLDLLADAGGVLADGAGDQATLLRPDGSKTLVDLAALFDGDPEQNPVVAAGDSVYVPRAPQFYIYGEVQKPGVYRLERNMTVSRAIAAGGGLTPRGSERRIVVKRAPADSVKERELSVRGSDVLQAADVLVVKESVF